MGVFKSSKSYAAPVSLIKRVVDDVCTTLRTEGYEVHSEMLLSGGADISLTKGNVFQAVLGMKTALKIKIEPEGNTAFNADASVGIFGQQAIPTAIMLFVAWPVLIPQIWGLIQQSKLDEHVLDLIEQSVERQISTSSSSLFCPHCGHQVTMKSKFCEECGDKI